MANEVTVFTKRPEYALVKRESSSLTKALAGGGGFPGKRISIKGGVFRLISDGKELQSIEDRFLDVVIVRAAEHIGRTYYSQAFSEDNPAAPDCWSADGVKPDPTAHKVQAPQCATCPQNIKGSGNEDSRACRFSQRVAVTLANDMEGDVMQLNLPATSLFGKEEGDNRPLQAYARYLSINNADIDDFITRLKFDVKAPNPKLFFKPMRWLEIEEREIAKEKGTSEEAVQACTMTVAQMDRVAAPATTIAPAVVSVITPALEASEPETDDEPPPPAPSVGKKRGRPAKVVAKTNAEPTIRASAAAPELPKRGDIASLAARWEEEDK